MNWLKCRYANSYPHSKPPTAKLRHLSSMNFRVLLLLLLTNTLTFAGDQNLVYKGSFVLTDLLTKKVMFSRQIYLVLGEETPVSESDRYATMKAAIVVYVPKGALAKRYQKTSFGVFRTAEKTIKVKGKDRQIEVFQHSSGHAADGNVLSESTSYMLFGTLSSSLAEFYDAPLRLTGTGLALSSGVSPADEELFATASRAIFSLSLAREITDPIPSGEKLEDSVQRVVDYLEDRGYIELAM